MKKSDIFYISLIVLGAVWMAFLGNTPKFDKEICPYELIHQSAKGEKAITTDELAKKLMMKDPSILLIDVRSAEEFAKFSLPGSINIPIANLLDDENRDIINQEVMTNVFYSNGSDLALKAWVVTERVGFKNNRYLAGGLNRWVETILKPIPPKETDVIDEIELYEFRKVASTFFGKAQAEVSSGNAPAAAPSAPAAAPAPAKKKKAEGGGGCG